MANAHKNLVNSSLLAAVATATFFAGAAEAAVTVYTTEGDLVSDLTGAGGSLSFLEDFEAHDPITNPLGYSLLPGPLDGNPNGEYTSGINPGLSIDTNYSQVVAQVPGAYSGAITSTVIGNLNSYDRLLISFTGGDVFGVGMDIWGIGSFIDNPLDGFDYEVFDTGGASLGSGSFAAPDAASIGQFFGVSSTDAIGSISIAGNAFGFLQTKEFIDNVQAWSVPTPGALALFGLAGLGGTRRRRA